MKISIKQVAPDVYALSFDDVTVAVDGHDLKMLLSQVAQLLGPKTSPPPATATTPKPDPRRDFIGRLGAANDIGLQALVRTVSHDDLLAVLKFAEADAAFCRRIFATMSERSATVVREDLHYKFGGGISEAVLDAALQRVMAATRKLESDETLIYPS